MWISPKHPNHNEVTRNCSCHRLDLCSHLLWRSHCFKHRRRLSQILKIHHHIWEHFVQLVRDLMPTATGIRKQSAIPELTGAEALKHSVQLWAEREGRAPPQHRKLLQRRDCPRVGMARLGASLQWKGCNPGEGNEEAAPQQVWAAGGTLAAWAARGATEPREGETPALLLQSWRSGRAVDGFNFI